MVIVHSILRFDDIVLVLFLSWPQWRIQGKFPRYSPWEIFLTQRPFNWEAKNFIFQIANKLASQNMRSWNICISTLWYCAVDWEREIQMSLPYRQLRRKLAENKSYPIQTNGIVTFLLKYNFLRPTKLTRCH